MNEEEKKAADDAAKAEADKGKPITDAFGQQRDGQGAPIEPKVEDKKEPKEGEGDGKKKDDKKADEDIENHPVVKGLKDAIESVKKEMGGNLAGQRDVIDKLQKKLKDYESGKKPEDNVLFKDIKRVKDLKADEQEAMTDNEKKLMDELADTREAMNKIHADNIKKAEEAQSEVEQKAADSKKTVAKLAQDEAKALAGDSTDLANQIIENFNLFAGNETLTPEQVKDRIGKAANMIKGYKPPKEQKQIQGKAPVADDKGEDPFGTNDIIKDVKGGKKGGYAL